jgi:hypothetical protein
MAKEKNGPKPLTGYMKHMKECLAKIKADKPDIKHMDAQNSCGKWKETLPTPIIQEKAAKKSVAKSAPKSGVRKTVTGGAACQESTCQEDYGQEESTC